MIDVRLMGLNCLGFDQGAFATKVAIERRQGKGRGASSWAIWEPKVIKKTFGKSPSGPAPLRVLGQAKAYLTSHSVMRESTIRLYVRGWNARVKRPPFSALSLNLTNV